MMDIIYTVLYTHQKKKKAKTWQDGTLKVLAKGTKAVLYDEKGFKLDALHVHPSDVISGEQLESDRFYIQVEEVQKHSTSTKTLQQLPVAGGVDLTSSAASASQYTALSSNVSEAVSTLNVHQDSGTRGGAGLKRKRSGFVPPRLVKPRPADVEVPSSTPTTMARSFYGNTSIYSSVAEISHSSNVHQQSLESTPHASHQSAPVKTNLTGSAGSFYNHVCERVSPSASASVGASVRNHTGALYGQPQKNSFKSPGSQSLSTTVMRSSPWRTFGSMSSNASPLLQSHSVTTWRKDQSTGGQTEPTLDTAEPALDVEGEEGSLRSLHNPTYPLVFPQGSLKAQSMYPENWVKSGVSEPVVKRSASEIMALLVGKKKQTLTENSVNVSSLQSGLSIAQNNSGQSLNSDCLQTAPGCSSFNVEVGRNKTPSSRRGLSSCGELPEGVPRRTDVSVVKPEINSCFTEKLSPEKNPMTEISMCHAADTDHGDNLTPELSGSISSLSKHDFEEEEEAEDECFYEDNIASEKTVEVSCHTGSMSDFKNSHKLSECNFSESHSSENRKSSSKWPQDTSLEDFRSKGLFDCKEKESSFDAVEEISDSSHTQLAKASFERGGMTNIGGYIEDNTEHHLAQSRNFQRDEDIEACFHMSLSPLSEAAASDDDMVDREAETNNDQDCETTGSTHPLHKEDPGRELPVDTDPTRMSPELPSTKIAAQVGQVSEKLQPDTNDCERGSEHALSGSAVEADTTNSIEDKQRESVLVDEVNSTEEWKAKRLKAIDSAFEESCLKEAGGSGADENVDVGGDIPQHINSQRRDDTGVMCGNVSTVRGESSVSLANSVDRNIDSRQMSLPQNIPQSECTTDCDVKQLEMSSGVVKSRNKNEDIPGDMKMLDDIEISPDPFMENESSQSPCQDTVCNTSVPQDFSSYASTSKYEAQPLIEDDTDTAYVMKNLFCTPESEDCHKGVQREGKEVTNNIPQDLIVEGEVGLPSENSPAGLIDTKVCTPSPGSFIVPDHGLSPDIVGKEDPDSITFCCDSVKENICLSANHKRRAVNVSVTSKAPRFDSFPCSGQPVTASPKNLPAWHDQKSDCCLTNVCKIPSSSSLPVHKLFQTVSEVLGENKANQQVLVSPSLSAVSCKEPTSELLDEGVHFQWQGGKLGAPVMSSVEEFSNSNYIPVSSLPHPDQLLKGGGREALSHRNSYTTSTPDITQAISARLTKYKMQGMLASDMVERPVAYKPDTDQVLLPLTHVSTHPALHAHSSATMPMGRQADFDSPDDILPGTGSLFSRETADQITAHLGERNMIMQTSSSWWTPEARLHSPSGDMENTERSLFVNVVEEKHCLIKSSPRRELQQHGPRQLSVESVHQVPLLLDGMAVLKVSQRSPGEGRPQCAGDAPNSHMLQSSRKRRSDPSSHRNKGHRNSEHQNLSLDIGCQSQAQVPSSRLHAQQDFLLNSPKENERDIHKRQVREKIVGLAGNCENDLTSVHSGSQHETALNHQHSLLGDESSAVNKNVSPLLFSQCPKSQAVAGSFNSTQRVRKLQPVLTAPDEVTYPGRTQRKDNAEEKDFTVDPEARDDNRKLNVSCHEAVAMVSENLNGNTRLSKLPNKKQTLDRLDIPTNCDRDPQNRPACDDIETMDFSGFGDSFSEPDAEDSQPVCAESNARSVCSTSQLADARESNCDSGFLRKRRGEDRMPADDVSLLHEKSGEEKVKQSCAVEDIHSSSSLSSPAYVIANDGLDYVEEQRINPDSNKKCITSQENVLNSNRKANLLKKASRLTSHFQSLHPAGNVQRREYSKFPISRQDSGGKPFIVHKAALRSFSSHSLGKYQDLSENFLTPSASTDSPPLDVSPEIALVRDTDVADRTCDKFHVSCPQTALSETNFTSIPRPGSHQLTCRSSLLQSDIETRQGFCSKPQQDNVWPVQRHSQTEQICPNVSSGLSNGGSISQADTRPCNNRAYTAPRMVGLRKVRKSEAVADGSCLPHSQELQFFGREEVESQATPVRQVVISPAFDSVTSYKQILSAALTEFMNIQLFGMAKAYHCALSKVDVSAYTEGVGAVGKQRGGSSNPACQCSSVSKVAQVKKDGPNKGRFFYTCSAPRGKQCKFFQWVDRASGRGRDGAGGGTTTVRPKFNDPETIMQYFRGQRLQFYCQCRLVHRCDDQRFRQGFPAWVRPQQTDTVWKKNMFIKLPKKDSASTHAKDDLWVVSKSLNFARGETFVARSTFHGPNSHGEVAVDPVAGYSVSLWSDGDVCHALHWGNAATELACMRNVQDHVNTTSLPVLPHLLNNQPVTNMSSKPCSRGFKSPLARQEPAKLHIPAHFVNDVTEEFITKYHLNTDQAAALQQAANMMNKNADPPTSVLLIHGVFGAGKSFLLSVLIMFLVELFQRNDSYSPSVPFPWKILLSSTTNVAVDRVLQGLLELGFEDFVRVGSVKKIAKPVLPYSVHAGSSESQELRDLQEMLKSQDITAAEKHCVRKSIEKQRLGENKKRLGAVRVVGVTCAACTFQCLDKMQFAFVVLDECSQMTEPASLLPIARFACEKLVLVGDPKQLDPTLQGADAAHEEGLEQTLFDRLMKMGHLPVMLRTQYRCHPVISAVSNSLFYHNQLLDGVTPDDRHPVLGLFPTLCFYNVSSGQEQTDASGSFVNEAEAQFVTLLLSVMMTQGLQATSVGVITLYKAQARRIVNMIRHSENDSQREMTGVQVSTVDAFQGGERDIIILSCVRTHSVGFIDSDKRMNVALTRARHHLLIVGHQRNLCGNRRWAQVISHCQAVPDGVVSASAASRQLQARLDQISHDQTMSPTAVPTGSCDEQT